MNREQLNILIQDLLEDRLSEGDRIRLKEFCLVESNRNEFTNAVNELTAVENADVVFNEIEWMPIIDKVLKMDKAHYNKADLPNRSYHRIHLLKTAWFRAAVAILLFTGVAAYLWNTASNNKASIVQLQNQGADITAPEEIKATITLSNGQVINLNDATHGTLAFQGAINIKKLSDGRIIYSGADQGAVMYNTIAVPKGSRIASLTLSDGTIVFLNAGSSFRYPTAFNYQERAVELTGEGYFEVAKDAKRKFIVNANGLKTEVLGTHFNISNYANDVAKKVTLIEGKVKVSNNGKSLILEPGQQAQSAIDLNKYENINIENVVAWKNGKFRFTNSSIDEVMNQFERWYNIDVEYQTKPTQTFSGGMPRSLSIVNALKILEATGGVHFKIENKKVIVMK